MEKIIIMPMKPIQSQQHQLPQFSSSTTAQKLTTGGGAPASSADVATCSTAAILSREERRHDSGSDSGTEQDTTAAAAAASSAESGGSVAQLIFELLEKTFSIIICRQQDDRDRDRVVMHFFRLVERRCLRREAFTAQHKAWFQTWLKRMDQVWDISNVMAAAELEAKRKYSHDFSMRRASLQSPSPRSNVLCPNFPRGVSPVGFASYGTSPMSGFNTPHAATAAALLAAASGGTGVVASGSGLLQPPTSDPRAGGQRRSVPDLNPPPVFPVHMKRNSYQGEHRMVSNHNYCIIEFC